MRQQQVAHTNNKTNLIKLLNGLMMNEKEFEIEKIYNEKINGSATFLCNIENDECQKKGINKIENHINNK